MLEDANRDIREQFQRAAGRRRETRRLADVVRAIDQLLFELEELNLQGADRVPARLRERAGRILEVLPEPGGGEEPFRVRFRVVALMDVLFQAQEVLFRMRDPSRRDYAEDGEDREDRLGA